MVLTAAALVGVTSCSHTTTGTATPLPISSPTGPGTPAAVTTSELMSKIRGVDPCSTFDMSVAKRYGAKTAARRIILDTMSSCTLLVGNDEGTVLARFRVTPGDTIDHQISSGTVEVAEPERVTNADGDTLDTCLARIGTTVDKVGHKLQGRLITPAGQTSAAAPTASCDAAKAMLTAMMPTLERLNPVPPNATVPVLFGKDPCAPLDQIAQTLPGKWRAGTVRWYDPYSCVSVLSDPSASLDVQVWMQHKRDDEQDPGPEPDGRHLTLAGLPAVTMRYTLPSNYGIAGVPDGGCTAYLTYKAPSGPKAGNAHLIKIELDFVKKGSKPDVTNNHVLGAAGLFDSCAEVERLAPIAVSAAGK
ncbi:hypothetical protein [Nocardia sp. XZ_19_369]|uniref:hypothetical protein n=1 Tax=Nocardia sp. XZ_19_369 TaxID=2769487 RepID=UPI00188F63F7|nr:hypothetical protein [Nocardia sp. XZ_19_369]